jgi:hypothetical protein
MIRALIDKVAEQGAKSAEVLRNRCSSSLEDDMETKERLKGQIR